MAHEGRAKTKIWAKIGKLTDDWITASYATATKPVVWKLHNVMNDFLEFVGLTDSEFIETYKRAADKLEWS